MWWSWSIPLPVWQQTEESSQTHVGDLGLNNSAHNVSSAGFRPSGSPARLTVAMGRFQVRCVSELSVVFCIHRLSLGPGFEAGPVFPVYKNEYAKSQLYSASRWLIRTLAVRFFQTALNADLKIKSVGLFSVHGVSVQFHPQHTLVKHWFPCHLLMPEKKSHKGPLIYYKITVPLSSWQEVDKIWISSKLLNQDLP